MSPKRQLAWAAVAMVALAPGVALAQPAMSNPIPIIKRPKFDPQSEFQAGAAAMVDHDYREAKAHFDNVLSVSPDHPQALYQDGVAEAHLGDFRGAARDFQAAQRSDPGLFEAAHQLALVDVRLGRAEQARDQLARLKHFQQTCASACAQASDIAAAVADVQSALSPGPAKPGG